MGWKSLKLRVLAWMFVVIQVGTQAWASNYCVALRGNGGHMPALWGALAQLVENFGLPEAVAGASSGSITAFFYESILANPLLSKNPQERQQQAALLLKSLVGFFDDRYGKYIRMAGVKKDLPRELPPFLEKTRTKYYDLALYDSLQKVVKDPGKLDYELPKIKFYLTLVKLLPVFYGVQLKRLNQAIIEYDKVDSVLGIPLTDESKKAALLREIKRAADSIQVILTMDIRHDPDVFWRDGVIRFDKFAEMMGFAGDFYAFRVDSRSGEMVAAYRQFLSCSDSTQGLSWMEIARERPSCVKALKDAIISFEKVRSKYSRLREPVGTYAKVFVSTGFVPLESKYVHEFYHYRVQWLDSFSLTDTPPVLPIQDFKVGYFGPWIELGSVEGYFKAFPQSPVANNAKSKAFYPLGPEPWEMALRYSPAEPGLSPFQRYQGQWASGLSLGGWADLAPVFVLKASGCDQVVYVTRPGSEPLNLQVLMGRLLGRTGYPWDELTRVPEGSLLAKYWMQGGLTGQSDPMWDEWFNLNRSDSVISLMVSEADAVVCSQWDLMDPLKQYYQIFLNGYRAPIYFSPRWHLTPQRLVRLLTPEDNRWVPVPELGGKVYPSLAGCIPMDVLKNSVTSFPSSKAQAN